MVFSIKQTWQSGEKIIMKFKTKLYLGFGLLIFLFIVFLLFLMMLMNQLNTNMKNAVDNYELAKTAYKIQDSLNWYRSDSKGILANPPADLLKEFQDHKEQSYLNANQAIETLRKLDKREKSQKVIAELQTLSIQLRAMEAKTNKLMEQNKDEEARSLFWYDTWDVIDKMTSDATYLQTIQEDGVQSEFELSNDTTSTAYKFIFGYAVAVLILAAAITFFILRSMSKNLNDVMSVFTSAAFGKGDHLPRIKVKTKDEIGQISTAYNEMAQVLEKHHKQEIELKNAAEEQSWLNTKIAEIATMYPGINNLNELAQLFITRLAPIVGASYGLIYMKEDSVFRRYGSYAGQEEPVGRESFSVGEGLVGQCALDRRPISLEDIPENYIKISSGTGEASPNSILVIPAEYQGEVLAVIELASFKPFARLEQVLLEEVVSHLGINIKSIQRHMRVEELLQESQTLTEELQSQSEELQLQQEELRTVNEQLEEQFKSSEKKTHELEKIKNMLEEKAQQLMMSSQYKSEFLANMSHELRTPLNSLLILAQMLSENSAQNLTQKQVEYAKTILSSGHDLLRLINDVLDISKIEAGKMEIYLEKTEIQEIKASLESQFFPLARQKGLDFSIQLDRFLPGLIHTDPQRLQQILINLLSNAFKFTEKGRILLQIEKAKQTVFSEEKGNNQVETMIAFSVRDTGIGISVENQKLIFEAFQQADGTTSRKYGGTGLGLSISRELAQLLGGYLTVDSKIGEGSTFTLYIPGLAYEPARLEAAVTVEEQKPASFTGESLEGKKILIVDDDMRNIFALTTALESYFVEVVFAENGREGIDVLQKNPDIDLVLMDIMMPEMDGFEAIRAIRQMPEYMNLPIIALTAKAMKSDRKKCIEAGASDYISKPVHIEQLISIMRVWLYR